MPIHFLLLSQDIRICRGGRSSLIFHPGLGLNSGRVLCAVAQCDAASGVDLHVQLGVDTMQRGTFHRLSDHSWQAVNTQVRISPLEGLLPCLSTSLMHRLNAPDTCCRIALCLSPITCHHMNCCMHVMVFTDVVWCPRWAGVIRVSAFVYLILNSIELEGLITKTLQDYVQRKQEPCWI